MKRIALLLCLVLARVALPAQTTFEALYGGSGFDLGFSVQQTVDGGYILAGSTETQSPNGTDMVLIKTDALGNEEWTNKYGTLAMDMAYAVRQTSDGGYVLCGMFGGFGTDTMTVVRTTAQGAIIWEHQYPGGLTRDIGYCVQETADGGFVVCGFAGPSLATDVYVVKMDASGMEQWSSTIDLGAGEYANAIVPLAAGYIVLADNGESGSTGDLHLLRLDDAGDTLWTRDLGTAAHDAARGLWVTDDGGFVVGGGSGYPVRDVLLIRTDAQGGQLWQRSFGDPGVDELAYSIQQLDDGGFIACGRKETIPGSQWSMYLFRTDVDGYVDWERTFPQGQSSDGVCLDRTSDGGFVLVGTNTAIINGSAAADIYLVKTDGAGYSTVGEKTAEPFVVQVFPNPATDRVNIGLSSVGLTNTSLVDPTGRTVWQASFTGPGTYPLSIGHWCNGAYVLLFRTASGYRSQQRLVISR